MSIYHGKLAYGIRKYFPNFSGLEDWGGSTISETQWQAATLLNYAGATIKEKEVPLRSVFQFLKEGKTEGGKVFPYAPLSIDEANFFPQDKESGSFAALEDSFLKDWEKIKKGAPESVGETLLFLAKKYLSKVGCSPEMPHISAFEHIKTTAALAECMERSENGTLLLVGVGLDNIQGFCYDIVSSKAAKSLKGRSFYLQMLLDSIAQDILKHPAIKAAFGHIIYARGGKMFLLLPDNPEVRDTLEEIRENIINSFWEKYRASLYCYLRYQDFSATESNLVVVWDKLNDQITKDRKQKYNTKLIADFNLFFKPIEEGFDYDNPEHKGKKGIGKKQFCRVSGELIEQANLEKNNIQPDPTEPYIWVTEAVKFQSDLGEGLRDSKHYHFYQPLNEGVVLLNDFYFTGSPKYLSLPTLGNWMRGNESHLKSNFAPIHRRKLNDTDFLPNSSNGISYGFSFYGGNDQPRWTDNDGNERVKDFELLANRETTGEHFSRLGVARLDLDDLSPVAKKSNTSFALNATFSAQLDLILSGYINTIWKDETKEYKDFLDIVFAGGDDMLLVGRWDLVLDFIAEFRVDFRKFIGGRDDLTLCAGITLATPKFPIAKAVEMAGDAEDEAKGFNLPDFLTGKKPFPELREKNSFCLLGEVVSWEAEYTFVDYFAKKIMLWSNDENRESTGISASVLNRIIQFRQIQKDKKPNWRWLSSWYFQQAERDNKKSQAIFYLMKIFLITGFWQAKDGGEIKTFKVNPDRTLLLMAMAARLADFRSRTKNNLEEYVNQDSNV